MVNHFVKNTYGILAMVSRPMGVTECQRVKEWTERSLITVRGVKNGLRGAYLGIRS